MFMKRNWVIEHTSDEWWVTRKAKTQGRENVQGEIPRDARDDSATGGDDGQTRA